jgi:hypothetical protein
VPHLLQFGVYLYCVLLGRHTVHLVPHVIVSYRSFCSDRSSECSLAVFRSSLRRAARPQSMMSVFPASRETFVIANPHLPDCPMTHVSDGFLEVCLCCDLL